MATAATTIKTDFGRTFKGADDAFFYRILNQADALIVRHFPIRKKTLTLGGTAESGLFTLDARAVWIEACRWCDKPNPTPSRLGGWELKETNVDEQDTSGVDWRANPPGDPSEFMITANETTGQLQLDRPTDETTLTITAATTATPIVCTSSAAHGLADGDRVDIRNGLVMTAINGDFYAKVTGYSTTTFALYDDEDLTDAVVGSGTYTASSAIMLAEGSPWLQVYTRWHEAIDSSSSLPDVPMYPDIYIDLCCFLYAKRHDLKYVPQYKELFENMLSEQYFLTQLRGGRKPPRNRVVTARAAGYVQGRTTW